MSKMSLEVYDYATVFGKYFLPEGVGVVALFKWSTFSFGVEWWRHGLMIFIGPFAIGCGSVEDQPNDQ